MITSAPRPTQLKDPNDAAHDLLGRLNVHAEALDGLSIMATLSVSGESGSFPGNPNRLVTGIGAIAELLARDAWALSERFDEIEAARGQARRKVGAR